jgi:plastocyanin
MRMHAAVHGPLEAPKHDFGDAKKQERTGRLRGRAVLHGTFMEGCVLVANRPTGQEKLSFLDERMRSMSERSSLIVKLLVLCALLTVLLAACTISNTLATGGPRVHMGPTNFLQSSITIQKGQRVTLIQDASDEHIITNGSWKGSAQLPAKEAGAPTVNVTVSGAGSQATIGPFNTAGTFHLYCTIHQGMNLAVKVA